MSNQGAGGVATNELAQVANATGVPAAIKTRALNWLGRFIAGSMLYPAVEQARENFDTVAGRSKVNAILAEAVGRQAVSDPEIMERAKARFLGEHFRKQANVEAIAVLALEDLRESQTPPSAPVDDAADQDWLNVFSRYAEDASSERMQRTFAKILAGEIRNKGSFSPGTLRVVSELNQQVAQDFAWIWEQSIGEEVVKYDQFGVGEGWARLRRLRDAGLVSPHDAAIYQPEFTPGGNGCSGWGFGDDRNRLTVWMKAATGRQIIIVNLTPSGLELGQLLPYPPRKDNLLKLSERFRDASSVAWIDLWSEATAERVWSAPES